MLPADAPDPLKPPAKKPSQAFGEAMPLVKLIGKRLLSAVVTFVIITGALYAVTLAVPVEERALPYLPNIRSDDPEVINAFMERTIERYGLDDPFPVQYVRWLGNLLQGDWGYSPILNTDVLSAIAIRSPATIELTLYSLLLYIPLGLLAGAISAWRQGRLLDRVTQLTSFVFASIPPFVLGLALIAICYVQLGLFDLSRIGQVEKAVIRGEGFWPLTGMITIDGLLNFRPDISWQAIRHLVLPVVTLGALHLATLTLVTRASVAEELQKEYVLMAKGLGLRESRILFGYALRGALLPALTHTALSAAQVVTGVYVVEAIFNWHGVSELLTKSLGGSPDVHLALGFSVYSVIVVLTIMLILDILQSLVDPRVRTENH